MSFHVSTYLCSLLTGLDVRSPTGEVFKISKDATFQGGRIKSLDNVICSFLLKPKYCQFWSRYFQVEAAALKYPTLTKMTLESGGEHTDINILN